MLEKASDIPMLLIKHVKDELSPEEKQRLEDWINQSPDNRLVFEEVSNVDAFRSGMIEYYALMDEAEQKLLLENRRGQVVTLYAKKSKRFIYFAAASIILLMIMTGTYFFMASQEAKPVITQTNTPTPATEIPPAGNKAILTLSNGSIISLTDAGNGMIAKDGKSIISKKQDGEIVYENTNLSPAEPITYNTITTPRGGWYKVTLPDGTKVWLNAQTVLKYPAAFTGKERRVELSGEAYFEVKEDKARPFKVLIAASGANGHHLIEVLGTHFNVNAYQEEPQATTTLLEGTIRFTTGASTQHLASRKLVAGQRVVVNEANELKVSAADEPVAAIAWVNGKFAFEKRDLAGVMRELARWYDVDIKYAGLVQEKRMITGEIDRTMPLSKLLGNLEKMGTTRFQFEGRTIWVRP
jgi:transmembrane sensor